MFLHLSVILSMGGGVCPSACWDTHRQTPPGQTPPGQTPPGQIPPGRHATPGLTPPMGRHPPAQCMLGYTWLLLRTVRILLECILVQVVYRNAMMPHINFFIGAYLLFSAIHLLKIQTEMRENNAGYMCISP